ncbi:hypothetical protein [Paenibacillus lautus]|uniref:hypothetical protein n=1 Tax=Paenibacillus lautus TaxID=1401 RepID=UPI002DBCF467|nr:hypothetical protein [Paenibacillus lautus]MEC0257361.1 hypothetical protein [Paenibacillus lautus]
MSDSLFRYRDEQFKVVDLGAYGKVILSALDQLEAGQQTDMGIGGDYSSVSALRIYAEDVILSRTLKAPNLLLSVQELQSVEGALDTSGADGTTPVVPVQSGESDQTPAGSGDHDLDGTTGQHGGDNVLCIFQLPAGDFPVMLRSAGGKGGDGLGGSNYAKGGDGKNGGDGGTIRVMCVTSYKAVTEDLRQAYMLEPSDVTDKWKPLSLLCASADSRLREIALDGVKPLFQTYGIAMPATEDEVSRQAELLEDAFIHLDGSDAEAAGARLNDTLRSVAEDIQEAGTIWEKITVSHSMNVSGGKKGAYGEGKQNGKSGADGKPGRAELVVAATSAEMIGKSDDYPLVHPDQLSMLLLRARMYYFTADVVANPDGFTKAAMLLSRIVDRTAPVLQSEDLQLLYAKWERRLGTVDSVSNMQSLNREASTLLNQLAQGLDYYGHDDQYVPLGSLWSHQTAVDRLLDNLESIQQSYVNYYTNADQLETQISEFKKALDEAEKLIVTQTLKLQDLRQRLQDTATEIDGMQHEIAGQKQEVTDRMVDIKADVESASGYNLDDLISALTTVGFASDSSLIWIGQLADYGNKSGNMIIDDSGQHIRKDYLIRKLQACKADYTSLKEGYSTLDDGELKPDDPGADKLIVAESDMEEFLDAFSANFPEAYEALKAAFQDYIKKVMKRNTKIIAYNAMVNLAIGYEHDIQDSKDKIASYQNQMLAETKPGLPVFAAYMSKLYHHAVYQVMESLYLTARAYRYWALSDENIVTTALGGNDPAQMDIGVFRSAAGEIASRYEQAIDNRGRASQTFPTNPEMPGVLYRFPKAELNNYLEQLQAGEDIYFQINPAFSDTTGTDNPFAGLANVRLLRVRPWLRGVKLINRPDDTAPDRNILHLEIIHCGDEQIISPSGDLFRFSHVPISTHFKFDAETNEIMEDGMIGQENQDSVQNNAVYALVSPYSYWRLRVPDWNHGKVDLSQVTDLEIEFWGTHDSFHT